MMLKTIVGKVDDGMIDQLSEFEQLRCRCETQVDLNQYETSPSRCATRDTDVCDIKALRFSLSASMTTSWILTQSSTVQYSGWQGAEVGWADP